MSVSDVISCLRIYIEGKMVWIPLAKGPVLLSLIKWKLLARGLRRLIEAILFCMLEQETVRSSSLKRIQK